MHSPDRLTNFHPLAPRYFGYTAMDWLKFYGFLAGGWFAIVFIYTRYFELFDGIENQEPSIQNSILGFALSGLLLVIPAIIGFLWWASGALVKYSRWQESNPVFWRYFWLVIMLFYGIFEMDPLDRIHPAMSRQGLAPALNLLKLFEGKVEYFPFQWGYFILWVLFWFLIIVLHWKYICDGVREAWFYVHRFHRYGASLLTGFNETAAMTRNEPVTVDYPRESISRNRPACGMPRLAVPDLSPAEAQKIIEADPSRSITLAPGQDRVLFIDLGQFVPSGAIAGVTGDNGRALVTMTSEPVPPCPGREGLVMPLKHVGNAGTTAEVAQT